MKFSKHFAEENRISASVIGYNHGEGQFANNNAEFVKLLESVGRISIPGIDTHGIISTLKSPAKKRQEIIEDQHGIKSTEKEYAEIPFKELKFGEGVISFEHSSRYSYRKINIEIQNDFVRPEFEFLKYYFSNVLSLSKVKVSITLKLLDDNVESAFATSTDLARINCGLLPEMRLFYLNALIKNTHNDRVLIEVKELDSSKLSNLLEIDEQNLIKELIDKSKTKHARHIEYLSSKNLMDSFKIQIGPMNRSVLFLVQGKTKKYFVWETFNTEEATYIWPLNDDVSMDTAVAEVSSHIKEIADFGKQEYIHANSGNFIRVIHDYSDEEIGFNTWLRRLEHELL